MPTVWSVEGRIQTRLRTMGCSDNSFTALAKQFQIQTSAGSFSRAMNDQDVFGNEVGSALLGLLHKMHRIQEEFPLLPIDWSQTRVIETYIREIIDKLDRPE